MILLTVGTQLPFDRLVEAVDVIAAELQEPVIGQVGAGTYVPKNIQFQKNFTPAEFQEYMRTCSKIVSHAGIGTILNAQKFSKPIILVPRLARFKEHRNDHQIATCRSLSSRPGIYVHDDTSTLTAAAICSAVEPLRRSDEDPNRVRLISALRELIGNA